MLRFFVCIAWIALLWQPSWGQSPSEGKRKPSGRSNTTTNRNGEAREDQIGTPNRPLVIDTQGHQKSEQEATGDRAEKEHVLEAERRTLRAVEWTAYATIALVIVGLCGTGAAVWTLLQVKRQADLIERQAEIMEKQLADATTASAKQTKDVQASIAEAVRSATAMEGVAASMSSNAESVRQSVAISEEIATTQRLAIELQGRAYLSVFFEEAMYQDINHVFEVSAVIKNYGNTPAYDVGFKAVAQVVPMPLPEEFAYPLPDNSAATSVSLIAPGTTKTITRAVSGRVSDNKVEAIKRASPPQCLAMWGIVNYRDAFNKTRHTKFAFTLFWRPWVVGMDKDSTGNPKPEPVYSRDTSHHNEAD
jgi:hypothetical protein